MLEKVGSSDADHIDAERKPSIGLNEDSLPNYNDAETKRILRKVDLRLLPVLALLYVLAFLDRSNIGNARVAGMNTELGLTSTQYNIALTVFFFPYAILEGIVMTLQGIVQNYHGLVATRVMLGFAECGLFPAATYLLTTWYCRFEVQTRLAVFFSASSMANAFSGLLAFGIQHMDGVGGLSGWRWIFILEGILTVTIGVTVPWILVDSPETASFLEPFEKKYIIARLRQDSGSSSGQVNTNEGYQWRYLKAALTEWKIYFAVIIYWGDAVTLYGFTYTVPSIINELGYSAANAQLLTVPIYVLGIISVLLFAWLSDRQQVRWIYIIGPYSIAMVGFIALLVIPHPRYPGLTYAFLFAIPAGVYPPLIGILSWIGNNLGPSWKRAVGMAMLISMGNLGGAIGSNIYIQQQAPNYWLGYGFSLGILLAANICTVILRLVYIRENKLRDAMKEEDIREKYGEEELLAMGDKSPLYRYVV
ncbi:hypothetical protein LTR56_011913 [Elasticomyces elasticus]|nr:hypothetical protein LTR56_011913 [Elasticomyces elasticus]KAK5759344.1 hypothetical protein LTS12_010507 [Elasticomyces elasticus]